MSNKLSLLERKNQMSLITIDDFKFELEMARSLIPKSNSAEPDTLGGK